MSNILILTPFRPSTHPALVARAAVLADALIAAHPEHPFIAVRMPVAGIHTGPRYSAHADARNTLLDLAPLGWADLVLWADVDLIDYPADLVRRLLALDGIAAPAVVMRGRFYDIGGFIQPGGAPFRQDAPWCAQPGPVVDLESVGCLYLAPAWIYRDPPEMRYRPDGPAYGVEHHSVCSAARALGVPVRADLSILAEHAWPPDYGEAPH
jgi:hypothetical protein